MLGPFRLDEWRLRSSCEAAFQPDLAVSEQTYRVLGPDDRVLEERKIAIHSHFPMPRPSRRRRGGRLEHRRCTVITTNRPLNPRVVRSFLPCLAALEPVALFRRSGQSENPWKPTPQTVDRGPFRITRNPMYLQILVCIGVAVSLMNGWILALTPLCRWVLVRLRDPAGGGLSGAEVRPDLPGLQAPRSAMALADRATLYSHGLSSISGAGAPTFIERGRPHGRYSPIYQAWLPLLRRSKGLARAARVSVRRPGHHQ